MNTISRRQFLTNNIKSTTAVCLSGFCEPTFAQASISADHEPKIQLGVAHIGGDYHFTHQDFLNEGAATIQALGAQCIKTSLSLDTENPSPIIYSVNSNWPAVKSLTELVDTYYFRNLLARDFQTFIFNAFRPGRPAAYWRDTFTNADEQAEIDCFAELTKHLLKRSGPAKTFVLQNWEGDWAVRGRFDPTAKPTATATDNMIRWLAARQRGVALGCAEVPWSNSKVRHACEVNLVWQAMQGGEPSVVTHILPNVDVDLVSYSAWDTKDNPSRFSEALSFISSHKRLPDTDGKCGVYIGEFGLPESEATPEIAFERTRDLLAKSVEFGCPFAVYWQLYCNEPLKPSPVGNSDYKGFWLVRPDGSRSPVCRLFRQPGKANGE